MESCFSHIVSQVCICCTARMMLTVRQAINSASTYHVDPMPQSKGPTWVVKKKGNVPCPFSRKLGLSFVHF